MGSTIDDESQRCGNVARRRKSGAGYIESMMARRYVMLDRDGTLIVERHYLADPEQVELLPGVLQALRQLRKMGLGLILVSNQSGIGRGYFDLECLHRVHQRLEDLLGVEGGSLDGVYFCPHVPEDRCSCRKPATGMVERASRELGFDPKAGFVIGDKVCDVDVGRGVGAVTFLVRTGYGASMEKKGNVKPDYAVDNLLEAVPIIGRHMHRLPDANRPLGGEK